MLSSGEGKKNYRVAQPANLTPAEYVRIGCEVMELKQREVARRAGISEQALSDIIHGRRPIGARIARKLSPVIRVPIERLLGDTQERDALERDLLSHIRRARNRVKKSGSMSEETQRFLLQELEGMEADLQRSA